MEAPRVTPRDTQLARDERLREAAQEFLDAELEFVHTTGFPIVMDVWGKNPTLTGASPVHPATYLNAVMPLEVFDVLAAIVNRNRDFTWRNNLVAASTKKFYKHETTSAEMMRFYGMIMMLENRITRTVHSIRGVLKKVREEEQSLSLLGLHRFEMIMRCLIPTTEEFLQLFSVMREANRRCWTGEGLVVLDETLYEYQPSAETRSEFERNLDPIPVVFIPRKPHQHGLLNYQLVTRSSRTRLPYVIDFEPKITLEVTPRSAMFSIVSRWDAKLPALHLVADSAFSGITAVADLGKKGLRVTCSMSSNEQKLVWELLEKGLLPNSWRACRRKDGIIMSVYRSGDAEEAMHHLINSSFYNPPPNTAPPFIPTSAVPPQSQNSPPQSNVPRNFPSQSRTSSQTPSPLPIPAPPPFQAAVRRSFTLPALLKMTLHELRELAKRNNVRPGGKKEVLANRIVNLCNPPALQVDKQNAVLDDANRAIHLSIPPHHSLYRANFNGVDLHNRYWYRFPFSFRCCNWRSKMVLSILGSAVVNAWVLACEDAEFDLSVFRVTLSHNLLS